MGDKQSLPQVSKMLIFKLQVGKVFLKQTIGRQSVISPFPYIYIIFIFIKENKKCS